MVPVGCALAVACTRRAMSETSPPPQPGERQPEPLPRQPPITFLLLPTAGPDPGCLPAAPGSAACRIAHDQISPFLTMPHPAAPQAAREDKKASKVLVVGGCIGRVLGDDLGAGAAGTRGACGGAAGDGRAREPGLLVWSRVPSGHGGGGRGGTGIGRASARCGTRSLHCTACLQHVLMPNHTHTHFQPPLPVCL